MASSIQDIERHVLGDVWTSGEIYANLKHLCDKLGSRFGGTGSEHAGALFLLRKMQDYGLKNPRLEKFPVYAWDRGDCELMVTTLPEREISAIAMPFCPSGVFRGRVIDLGEGETADFERAGDAVRGKIVLSAAETNRPGEVTLHRTDKYRLAVEAGAVGHIMVNKNPGLLHITGALYAKNPGGPDDADHEAPIPAIGITYEAGCYLRRILDQGITTVRITLNNTTRLSHSYNVIGDIPGGESPEEIVLFGGHYDAHDIAPGAGDDAAGTLVGVEIGRVLAPFAGRLKRTVRIICFAYEELGLGGSFYHADQYAAEGNTENLRIAMNLDGAGRGSGGQERVNVTSDSDLLAYFERLRKEMHYDFSTSNRISVHSDHFPFFMAGYPSATLNSADSTAGMIGRGYGHTEGDTVDKVSLRGLQMGAAFAARIALRLATVDPFPVERRDESVVHKALEDSGQGNFLEHHWGRDNRAV
jgi:aminopeptidase YwaD